MQELTISHGPMLVFLDAFVGFWKDDFKDEILKEKHLEELFDCWVDISVENESGLVLPSSFKTAIATPTMPPRRKYLGEIGLTEFHQPLQVQSQVEMPGILVQLGHIQHT